MYYIPSSPIRRPSAAALSVSVDVDSKDPLYVLLAFEDKDQRQEEKLRLLNRLISKNMPDDLEEMRGEKPCLKMLKKSFEALYPQVKTTEEEAHYPYAYLSLNAGPVHEAYVPVAVAQVQLVTKIQRSGGVRVTEVEEKRVDSPVYGLSMPGWHRWGRTMHAESEVLPVAPL